MMNSQQQQTPQPTRSTPLHPSRPSKTPMMPTPSSSRSATLTHEQLLQSKLELEQQLTDKEQQCQDCESGIQKNVLTRQISQIRDKLVELDQQIQQVQQVVDIPPATIDKIRHLERDLANYRGQQRKDKLFPQRGLDILPSPSTSTILPPNTTVPNSSLLPLPPPPSGSTPTKRRSKVPNNDRRNTDIEFATEIGQGLLIEVRKMQAILQEKEEQLRALEIQKADLERSAEAMAKQLRQREENEEKLKEETWNLELTKQELTLSVTELQQHLHKATSEQTKLAKQTNDLRSDIDQLRDREEKLTALLETSKQRHEQDMTGLRRHCAGLQREAQQHAKHIDTLTSELAIAKAQSRLGKHQSATSTTVSNNNNSSSNGQPSSDDSDPSTQDPQYRSGSSSSSPPSSPKQAPVGGSGGRTAQAMEVETLKTSLAHAHRMVSNLRSHLHKEKTEKFEFKKLLAESQETIEQLQNDPHLWVDAPASSSSHQGGVSANGSLDDQKKRKVKQHRRATRKLHRAGLGSTNNTSGNGGTGTPPLSSSRSISLKHHHVGDSFDEDDEDDAYSYSSVSEDDDPLNDANEDTPPPAGFTSLSLELSQSSAKLNNSAVEMGVMTEEITIVHDRYHYEQQLQKLHQLEEWHQASLDRMMGWTVQTQLGIDQAPLISCETTTQTDPLRSEDVALQTLPPDSLDQECQCDLILPRDEAAEALALTMATSAAAMAAAAKATKDADLKSAEAIAAAAESAAAKAKEEAALELSAAVESATSKIKEVASLELSSAVESAIAETKEEAALELSSAIESATIRTKATAALELASAVELATTKAKEEAALELTTAVESATAKVREEAALKLSLAMASVTAKTKEEAALELNSVMESAAAKTKEEAALELSSAVESAIAKTKEEAALELSSAVESAITKTKEAAALELSLAVESAITKTKEAAALELSSAVESAIAKTKEEEALELSSAVESAIAKTKEEEALELSSAVESATTKTKEAAALELTLALESATTKLREEAALELSSAVESAKAKAKEEAALELSASVELATAKVKEAAALELTSAVESAVTKATMDTEAKLAAAIAVATIAARKEAIAESEALLDRSSTPSVDQGTQCSFEGVATAAQVDPVLAMDAGVQYECYSMDTAVQHEHEYVDTAVQHEYTPFDQQTHNDTTCSAIDSATQHESITILKDVSTQCEPLEKTSTTAIPATVNTSTDPIISSKEKNGGLIIAATTPTKSQAKHGNRDISERVIASRIAAPVEPMDNTHDWLGSLNDDGPISLDRSTRLTTPSDNIYTNESDLKLHSQEDIDAKAKKAMDETMARNNEQLAIHHDTIAPARPTQRPPSSLLDKATKNSSIIAHTTAASDYFDDAGTFSGLNRQASLSSSYMTTDNTALSRPSNALQYGTSSSSGAGITPPSITSSIHDEHSIMVRPLPNTPDPTISSITQTMIGEWLIKYTRKPMGGQGFSERRHERYFWIHPYTRTLYWCTRAPGAEGGELKAKSAFVENVSVGKADEDSPDANGVPCLLIQTTTRQIKIRAPTKERHDLWLESLMYLLTRPSQISTMENTPSLLPQRSVSASILRKPSIQRFNDIFHRTASASPYSQDLQHHHHHHHHHQHDDDDDNDDDALENVRLCCDGKHDVGRLEKNYSHRPAYHQRKQHHSSSMDHTH